MSARVIILLYIPLALSLKLLDLQVPDVVDIRESVSLQCRYELAGESLYSLKWYKEELEFFRYVPSSSPQILHFSVEGINVVPFKSNATVVTLSPLDYKSTGVYKCEVSTEKPHFKIVYGTANMSVLGLPREQPSIEGVRTDYHLGEYILGNCTSAPSNPPAQISWLINDQKIDDWFLERLPVANPPNSLGLEVRSVGVRFQLDNSHFQSTGSVLFLKCKAVVGGRSLSRVAKITLKKALTNQKFAQEFNRGTADKLQGASLWRQVFLLLTALYFILDPCARRIGTRA